MILVSFLAGFLGASLWGLGAAMWRRKRWVVTTREMVVRHPEVTWQEPGEIRFYGNKGDLVLIPSPRVKQRKLTKRERALRALGGYPNP